MTTAQAQHHSSDRVIKIKCLVLGAAGAGKTSLLRRYFHHKFDAQRRPTRGSDFYTSLTTVTLGGEEAKDVRFQMWDTPGRERCIIQQHQQQQPQHHGNKRNYNQATPTTLGHSFFQHADAILLVYDVTSSTSFTQLIRWYGDLKELHGQLPFVLLANKVDLFRQFRQDQQQKLHKQQQQQPSYHQKASRPRDVMGLGGNFRGRDFRYEYQVSSCVPSATSIATERSSSGGGVIGASSSGGSHSAHHSEQDRPYHRRMEISSFLGTHDNWTDDWSYLASLLHTEDVSHPDREMVLLWCMRNGLTHCEASARTGEGVAEAIETLQRLAVEAKVRREQILENSVPTDGALTGEQQQAALVQKGNEAILELHQRYAQQQDGCLHSFVWQPLANMVKQPTNDAFYAS